MSVHVVANESEVGGCEECGGRLEHGTSEIACTDCGLVQGDADVLDYRPTRAYTSDESLGLEAVTEGMHDRGIGGSVGRYRDARGNVLSSKKRKQLYRLRRLHGQARFESKAKKNLALGLTETGRLCTALGLSRPLCEQAQHLFRSTQSAGLLVGRSIEAMAAGAVWATIRLNGLPRQLTEVEQVAATFSVSVSHAYSVLNQELGLPTPPPDPRDHVAPIAGEIGLSPEDRARAAEYCERAVLAELHVGRRPRGFAAACIDIVRGDGRSTGDELTLADLADVAGSTPVTVRRQRQLILENGIDVSRPVAASASVETVPEQ